MTDRRGGDLVTETLAALGCGTVFGIPGQHALGLFDAVRRAGTRLIVNQIENNAAFAATGHAQLTGAVTPLLLSTGPGALTALPGLQEAAASSVPVLGICSQIPTAGLGGARRGFLHELPDQSAAFRGVVKSAHTVRHASQIPSALAAAWQTAATPPFGPTWVEIPQDVLLDGTTLPPVRDITAQPVPPLPREELIAEAAALLDRAERPVIIAGGGVRCSGGQAALEALAEKLRAPVVTTFGGKGAFRWEHPLSARSWLEDRHTTGFLEEADVLVAVGTGLGELSSNYHTFAPRGRVIQIEADAGKLEANHPALGIHADARRALEALGAATTGRPADGHAEARTARLLADVADRIAAQGLEPERRVLAAVRDALPDDAPSFWDMTILAYWAWSAWDPRDGAFHSAQGAGGLGYGLPAALGAAVAMDGRGPVLAVSGDGGAMYGIAELATAVQHGLRITWLIIDDGGHGILREYMTAEFGVGTATELSRPDFATVAEAFGVPAVTTTAASLHADLADALADDGPRVVVLPARLRMFAPT